jgi:hypothetical protein
MAGFSAAILELRMSAPEIMTNTGTTQIQLTSSTTAAHQGRLPLGARPSMYPKM